MAMYSDLSTEYTSLLDFILNLCLYYTFNVSVYYNREKALWLKIGYCL